MIKRPPDLSFSGTLRPLRFAQPTRIEYRPRDGQEWRSGQIINVSRTGVLFQAADALTVNAPVDMRFELPVEAGGEEGALVLCSGEVVRIVPNEATGDWTVAVRILDHHFARSADAE